MKKKLYEILEALGLRQKFEERQLSNEEYQSIAAEYQRKYGVTLQDDISAESASAQAAAAQEEQQQALEQIYGAVARITANGGGDGDGDGGAAAHEPVSLDGVINAINSLGERFHEMAARPAEDHPVQTVHGVAINVNGPGNTAQYLFGIETPMFSMDKRWNRIAANPRSWRSMHEAEEDTDGRQFRQAARAYAKSLAARYAFLQANKMLDAKALAAGTFSNNYEGVENAGLGNQYVILRQDALIARVLQKRDLTQFFPVRYGIQDRDLLFNAYFGELSQGYQAGEVYKGELKIENEMGYVDDAMIKLKFGPMKELERMYIAYLNKEGSDPIKWSMIEYCILHELETAQVEQNKRRVRGIFVTPETGVAGSYLNAGTGIVYTLLRYVHDYSIKPHDDADGTYRSYDSTTMLDAVKAFISDVKTSISEDMDIDNHVLYLNKSHQDWWIACVRKQYHLDTDFTGPNSYLYVVPDSGIRIVWLPYLGKSTLMFLDVPGNIQFLENIPGEMLNIKMEEQMEMVRAWSTWKEGCGAAFTGRKFTTKAAMDANAYEWQQIFMNLPVYTIADSVDGTNGFWQMTGDDTSVTAITDIANAKSGVAYCIEVGSTKSLPKIAKSDKFANITEDFTPTAVGDYIMVILRSDNTFYELERCVDGKRTINTALQPNVPGGR